MKKMCDTCPFNFTDKSEQVQNYGCLPSPMEILNDMKVMNKNWACHCTSTECAGFRERMGNSFNKNNGLAFEVGVHGSAIINYKL